MPVYLYECKTCQQRVSVARGIKETETIPTCIECAEPMLRQYGVVGVSFKGSGYYSTDNGKQ